MSTGQAETRMAAEEHLRLLDAYRNRDRLRAAELIRWHLRVPTGNSDMAAQDRLFPTVDGKEV